MENKDYFYHYSSVGIKFVYLCIMLGCLTLFVYLFENLRHNLIAPSQPQNHYIAYNDFELLIF